MVCRATIEDVQKAALKAVMCIPRDRLHRIRTIVPIPSGGYSAALAIASALQRYVATSVSVVSDIDTVGPLSPLNSILVVDDVYDSGQTAERYLQNEFAVAVLFASRKGREEGRIYYGDDLPEQEYLVLPWEEHGEHEVQGPEDAVRRLLQYLGLDPDDANVRDTPRRVLSWLQEFRPQDHKPFEATAFEGVEYAGMVLLRDIPFVSMCEHHLLPFIGKAAVAYVPQERVLGLSKLARIVHDYARRPQVQERLTQQVHDAIRTATASEDVAVVLRAEHMCMSLRGPSVPGHATITSSVSGAFRADPKTREEFLNLAKV